MVFFLFLTRCCRRTPPQSDEFGPCGWHAGHTFPQHWKQIYVGTEREFCREPLGLLGSCPPAKQTNNQSKSFSNKSFHKNQRGRLSYTAQCIGRIVYYLNKKTRLFTLHEKKKSHLSEKMSFLTFPACFYIPIIFYNMNSNCSNLLDERNLQEQVKKAFLYQ